MKKLFNTDNLFNILILMVSVYIITPFENAGLQILEIIFFIIMSALSLFLVSTTKLKSNKSLRLIILILLLIAIINAIGSFFHINSASIWNMLYSGSFKIVGYILIGLAISLNVFDKNRISYILKFFVFITIVQSALSFSFYLLNINDWFLVKNNNIDSIHALTGGFNSPFEFGIYIMVSTLISCFLLISYIKNNIDNNFLNLIKNKYFIVYIAIIIFHLICIFILKQYLILFITLILSLIYFLGVIKSKITSRIFILIIFIGMTTILMFPNLKFNINNFLNNKSSFYAGAEIGYNNLFFGIGSDNYLKTIINKDKGLSYYTPFKIASTTPNCSYLLIFAENGVISLLLWITLVVIILYYCFKDLIVHYSRNFKDKNYDLSLSITMIFIAIIINSFLSNILLNPKIMIIFFIFLIYINLLKPKKIKKTNRMKIYNSIFSIFCTIIIINLVWVALIFSVINDYYGKKMERTRLTYMNQIIEMNAEIKNNLKNFYNNNNLSNQELNKYLKLNESYVELTMNYIKVKNSRWYKSRPFKDLFAHYKDLYYTSSNFSSASINCFFNITMPVQIQNYSAEKVLLPFYGYTYHKFPDVSDISLTYYINKGFNYSPLSAIRKIEKEYLLTGKYEKFKKLHQEISDLLEKRSFNGKEYLIASYNFTFNKYTPTWTSGMTQGVLLNVTANAYYLTGDNYYYDFAQKLLPAFYIDYKNGGVIYNDPKYNLPFLLEYAYGEKERELNGSIIGAIGLRSWYKVSGDEKSLQLYKNFIQDIIYRLKDYDYPMDDLPKNTSWSKYSLTVYPVQKSYHRVHLNLLASLEKDELINDLKQFSNISYYLNRWKNAYIYLYPNENIDYLFKSRLNDFS